MSCMFDRLAFNAEWYQKEANLTRSFILHYFPYDSTAEIFDLKTNKTFLKRTRVNELNQINLYVGAKVNILSRQMVLVSCADDFTRNKLTSLREKTFFLIKSDAIRKVGEIIKILCENGFFINNCVMVEMSTQNCADFSEILDKADSSSQCCLSPGPVVAIELIANDCVRRLKQLIGDENAKETNQNEMSNMNIIFGTDYVTTNFYYSKSPKGVQNEIDYFFPSSNPATFTAPTITACFQSSTLAIIKPHAIREGKLGNILTYITDNGFTIHAMKMFNLERENCEEFYEIYKGVVAEYLQMVIELSSGPFIALEITSETCNVYNDFRQMCGPSDPQLARKLRPNSIRAKFGINKTQNAIHCTDLEEDCKLEIEYFFKILS